MVVARNDESEKLVVPPLYGFTGICGREVGAAAAFVGRGETVGAGIFACGSLSGSWVLGLLTSIC